MLFLSKTVFFGGEGENAVAATAIGLQGGEGGEAPTSIKQPITLSRFGGGGKSPVVKAALANPPLLVLWSDRTPKEDTRRPPPPFPLLRSSLRRPDMQQKKKRRRKTRGEVFYGRESLALWKKRSKRRRGFDQFSCFRLFLLLRDNLKIENLLLEK